MMTLPAADADDAVAGLVTDPGTEPWPAVAGQPRTWEWPRHGPKPPRGDRQFREFEAAVPPAIGDRPVRPGPEARAALAAATEAVAVLDRSATVDLTALAGALLRSESVASSRIEHLRASQREVGLAMLRGGDPRSAAAHVAANVRAMTLAVARAADGGDTTVDDVLDVHRTLLADDPEQSGWAGHLRTVQNWVGGSFHSPRGALFVPPQPGLVAPLMNDLVRFCNRVDVDPVAQAAVAHAQFETIHPFTDGNGRTGRALVHVLLRRRGLVRTTVVPVSTVLLADVDAYFAGLADYRAGRLDVWLARFAAATSHAASAGLRLALDLAEMRGAWWDAARPRRGSVGAVLLEALLRQPVVDIDTLRVLAEEGGADGAVADKNLYRAVDRLVAADVLAEVSGGARNRVWAAVDVLDLLERFETDLGRRRAPL
ncbi:Fic family protein [Kineosporia sp. R_H_3]|uniref:Fic family protein n=1 Tax=Kineosporia sp. R_H_3 TaxID=1961848 RepID=UPI000B4BA11A|nr:Fic family protein [Kineosporia sp. R_H_3]